MRTPSTLPAFSPLSPSSPHSLFLKMAETKNDSAEFAAEEYGGVALKGTTDLERIEAPVTLKAYFLCAFASFGGIFFGYDSAYINGVTGNKVFIQLMNPGHAALTSPQNSLVVSILSAGTFFGAVIAGDVSDFIGRRPTIISGAIIYMLGVILQIAYHGQIGLIIVGRLISGVGVGFVSAIIILYMSEICPRKVRGMLVSGYQFCITVGMLIAACVNYGTQNRADTGSYRIPIGIQFAWGIILATGLFFLPESPRYFVKRGDIKAAERSLSRIRGQLIDSDFIQEELAEIVANNEYERQQIPQTDYIQGWTACFSGSIWNGSSNLRRTILGTSLQMMQQWTGVNFIFYFSTPFLQSTGAISNPFIISLIFTLVNVCSTPISFYTVEKWGRRTILLWGALGMTICQFICAIIGVTAGFNKTYVNADGDTRATNIPAVNAQISFIAIFIFFFASTWGPGAWVLIGEIFPLPIRSRGVGLSTASNWLWNCIISVITPYMVGANEGNLKSSVFFIWGALCACATIYTYFIVPETKGLSLEQIDRMLEETTPRTSAGWKPRTTFAAEMGLSADGHLKEHIGHREVK